MSDLPKFYFHKHQGRTIHYDLRLEIGDSSKAWTLPKGPSINPAEKRYAILAKDHIPEPGSFEGVIRTSKQDGDPIMIWDQGDLIFVPEARTKREKPPAHLQEAFERGTLKFELKGQKCKGRWGLIRIKGKGDPWLLVKDNDEYADREIELTEARPYSIKTFRTLDQIREKG